VPRFQGRFPGQIFEHTQSARAANNQLQKPFTTSFSDSPHVSTSSSIMKEEDLDPVHILSDSEDELAPAKTSDLGNHLPQRRVRKRPAEAESSSTASPL
jgi:hypothetical protein